MNNSYNKCQGGFVIEQAVRPTNAKRKSMKLREYDETVQSRVQATDRL
jgi:hypothetical protein